MHELINASSRALQCLLSQLILARPILSRFNFDLKRFPMPSGRDVRCTICRAGESKFLCLGIVDAASVHSPCVASVEIDPKAYEVRESVRGLVLELPTSDEPRFNLRELLAIRLEHYLLKVFDTLRLHIAVGIVRLLSFGFLHREEFGYVVWHIKSAMSYLFAT